MTKKEYLEYLKSESWQQKRRNLARSADAKCYCCGAIPRPGNPLDLHHLTYERLGHELPTDLVAICRSCHDIVHDLVKSSGSIQAATERVKALMGRKQARAARPYSGPPVKDRTHVVVAWQPAVRVRDAPVHPGAVGSYYESPERRATQEQKRVTYHKKVVARWPWHFAPRRS